MSTPNTRKRSRSQESDVVPDGQAGSQEDQLGALDRVTPLQHPSTPCSRRSALRPRTAYAAEDDVAGARPVHKRRKVSSSVTSVLLSTAGKVVAAAADAVILVTLLSMAAYQMWQGQVPQPRLPNNREEQTTQEGSKTPPASSDVEHADTGPPNNKLFSDPTSPMAHDLPPSYDSVYYKTSTSPPKSQAQRSRDTPSTPSPRRVYLSRSTRRRVILPATSKAIPPAISTSSLPAVTPITANATIDISPPRQRHHNDHAAKLDAYEDSDEDELFRAMSSRLQSMIQQGTDALSATMDDDSSSYSFTRKPSLAREAEAEADQQRHYRRQSTASLPSLIPLPTGSQSPDAKAIHRHRNRHSMG